jgi:hypothetical protein
MPLPVTAANISGKSVTQSKPDHQSLPHSTRISPCFLLYRQHHCRDEGQQPFIPVIANDAQHVIGPRFDQPGNLAQTLAGGIDHFEADQVGPVKLVFVGSSATQRAVRQPENPSSPRRLVRSGNAVEQHHQTIAMHLQPFQTALAPRPAFLAHPPPASSPKPADHRRKGTT